MGFLARAVSETKAMNSLDLFREIYGGKVSKSGQTITLEKALRVSALFACLKVLSQGVAQVPFKLFIEEHVDGLTKIRPAKEHPHYDLTATQPNEWSTSFDFRETLAIHVALGNAYVFKNVVLGGRVAELILIPGYVEKVQRPDYSIVYKVTGRSGEVQEFPSQTIWHVKGPSMDGLVGMDTLNLAREALGLAIATEESHAKLHQNGVRPSGTYSVDGSLSPQQYKDLKAWLDKEFAGSENTGAPMVLDRGAKWFSNVMTGLDAEHLATRELQAKEICRFLGMLPIMIGISDKATTYASAEQMFLAHVVHCLSPMYARIEQSADINLLTKKERAKGLYFKFIAAGLLRGASKDRAEYYSRALGSGGGPAWMSQDEVRALEELNPMGGEAQKLPPRSGMPASEPVAA